MMFNWLESEASRLESFIYSGGFVMLPLLLLCMVMWWLIANRLFFFRRMHRKSMSPGIALEHILNDRMPDPAQYGDATALLVAEYLYHRCSNLEVNGFILEETVQKISRRITAYLAVIGVLAAIAPLLGLLGTVTGMMETFDVLAVFGTGNAKAMASGISEALITTQTGLLIAIPGLYMKGFLDRRSRNLQQYVEAVGYYLKRHFIAEGNEHRKVI
jgi:biopolymer transport protein ExbB